MCLRLLNITCILFLSISLNAQVFIPFGFWKGSSASGGSSCSAAAQNYIAATSGTSVPFPSNCNFVTVKAWGGGGGGADGNWSDNSYGGGGGYAKDVLLGNPTDNLTVMVGGGGSTGFSNTGGAGGVNGGGAASSTATITFGGAGGGGYSGVMYQSYLFLAAGGGGGQGANTPSDFTSTGGGGGGATGSPGGVASPVTCAGTLGTSLTGGIGGSACLGSPSVSSGGGGGGGGIVGGNGGASSGGIAAGGDGGTGSITYAAGILTASTSQSAANSSDISYVVASLPGKGGTGKQKSAAVLSMGNAGQINLTWGYIFGLRSYAPLAAYSTVPTSITVDFNDIPDSSSTVAATSATNTANWSVSCVPGGALTIPITSVTVSAKTATLNFGAATISATPATACTITASTAIQTASSGAITPSTALSALYNTKLFSFVSLPYSVSTAGTSTFTVPYWCTGGLTVKAWGAAGGSGFVNNSTIPGGQVWGGGGGYASATIPSTAGQTVNLVVGSGGSGAAVQSTGGAGGSPGLGGAGGAGTTAAAGGGGGGYTSVAIGGTTYIIAGGGGGSAGMLWATLNGVGGGGGGTAGGTGTGTNAGGAASGTTGGVGAVASAGTATSGGGGGGGATGGTGGKGGQAASTYGYGGNGGTSSVPAAVGVTGISTIAASNNGLAANNTDSNYISNSARSWYTFPTTYLASYAGGAGNPGAIVITGCSNVTPVLSPAGPVYALPGDLITFTASGGSIYDWTITGAATADGATITTPGTTADYTARLTANTSDTVTAAFGSLSATANVYTYNGLSISPTTVTMAVSAVQNFATSGGCLNATCSGGTATWSVVSGSGSITGAGVFTAPVAPGTTVVQVADAIGNVAQATISIVSTLTISPITLRLPIYSTVNYSATLGTVPYTYSIFAGTGTSGCSSTTTGAHTNAVTTINVTNTTGCPSMGAIVIGTETICYTGITATTFTGATRGCNATTAAAYPAPVAYNSNKTVYTAPSSTGSGTVRVTDNVLSTSDSAVTHIQPTSVAVGYAFACALYNEGSVKCWGENNGGQLGIGSAASVGTIGTQIGGANAFVNLGAGRTATQITAGWYHVCALLDNSTVKCWGQNTYGQLGQGNTANVGTASVNDVANLAAINFSGKTPNQIFTYGYTSCAKFTDTTSTCWGLNTSGQAGQGTTVNITAPTTAINYGAGRYATTLAGGPDFSCAILDNNTVKCWGANASGQLGDGTTTARAVSPSTLTAINLGVGRTATDLSAGTDATAAPFNGHACAVLDNGTMACWGIGGNGQLGDNTSTNRTSPTQTTALGFTASKVWAARQWTCAKSTVNTVKCWGRNSRGQLLVGSATTQASAAAATVINWGTSVGFSMMSIAGRTGCMVTGGGAANNGRIKCWGTGANSAGTAVGVLLYPGLAAASYLGDVLGELGDGLPFLNH